MEVNYRLRDEIFKVVENQLRANKPAETRITLDRLIAEGYSEFEAKQFIGQCIIVEMFTVVKEQKPFNEDRYIKNLRRLPKEPFD